MIEWYVLIGPTVAILVFYGSAFFWLWTRIEEKRRDDKKTFIELYQKVGKLERQNAYMLGKQGVKYDEVPDTTLL